MGGKNITWQRKRTMHKKLGREGRQTPGKCILQEWSEIVEKGCGGEQVMGVGEWGGGGGGASPPLYSPAGSSAINAGPPLL